MGAGRTSSETWSSSGRSGRRSRTRWGGCAYLAFYLIGGLLAFAAQIAATPTSQVLNLGASGAIAAVMGAFIVLYPQDRIRTALYFLFFIRVTYIPAVLLIGVWFLLQLFSVGQVAGHVQSGGVAYLAHVGGFLFGMLTGRLWASSRPQYASYQ